jgi:RNA polymerase sigma-70 factor (ECF subfamily)
MAEASENSDEDVRIRLKQGLYEEAFELLLERYRNKIMRLAYSMIGNSAQAEDAAQDVCVRIWRALPAYRGESSVSTWVYAITRNTCLTAIAAMKRTSDRTPLSGDYPNLRQFSEIIPAPEPKPYSGPDLSQAIRQLPEKYRQAVMLFYMEEKSYVEVAAMMALPIGTVRTYLYRAKKALAVALMTEKAGRTPS